MVQLCLTRLHAQQHHSDSSSAHISSHALSPHLKPSQLNTALPQTIPRFASHTRWLYCQGPTSTCGADGEKALSTPPSPRSGHTVCLVGGKAYLFGGCGRSAGVEDKCLNDLHSFDVETLRWERVETRGAEQPAVRRSAAMCALDDGRFLLSGGAGDDPDHLRSDLYLFVTHTRVWTKLLEGPEAKPFCLCGQSACLWQDTILFFGGSTGLEYSNALHQYNLKTNRWQQLATLGPRPTPRYKHQAFIHGSSMYVIGGGCFKPLCEDIDVHRLDLTTMTWRQVATRGSVPMARVAHTCAYDSSEGGAVYMWGGFTAGLQCLRNFYRLSLDTHTWTAIPALRTELSPSARSFHGSIFSAGSVYVFSGSNGSEKFSDVWRYQQVRQTPPPLLTLAARALLAQTLTAALAASQTMTTSAVAMCGSDPPHGCGCRTGSAASFSSSSSGSGSSGGGGGGSHGGAHYGGSAHGHNYAFGTAFSCRRRKRDPAEGAFDLLKLTMEQGLSFISRAQSQRSPLGSVLG
ncbi:hypothetical protein JKP88DRAFT_197461 [Tribonema minus]|uniref:Uncharacterized protein n=1 Tax=Tribonema minus TaxID=303371 RepID=A0A836CLJ1_9STRA|nr:hypothetical protein JKP88DRAFT_197461 [Tribonema minus]